MRSFLVPAAIVLFGLAVMASPRFIPLGLGETAMPDKLAAAATLHAGSIGITIFGLAIAATGLLLGRRRQLRQESRGCQLRPPARLKARITAGFAALPAGTALLGLAALASPALAISLGEMAQKAGQDLETLPFFISVAFWIIGVVIFGFGLIKLKRHVDHPSQTTIGSGLACFAKVDLMVLIGVALLAAPSIINSVGETFAVDSTATITRPALD